YFVLDPDLSQLQYFVNEQGRGQKPRGTLPLIGASVTPSDETPHMFIVSSANGELFKLRAVDVKEQQLWMTQLQACTRPHSDGSTKVSPHNTTSVRQQATLGVCVTVVVRKLKDSEDHLYEDGTASLDTQLGLSPLPHQVSSGRTRSFSLLPHIPPSSSPGLQRHLGHGGGHSGGHGGGPSNIVTITHHKSPAAARRAKQQYPGRLLEVREVMSQAEAQQRTLVQSIEELPRRGSVSCLDQDLLLLKATSAATLSCRGDCLSILQHSHAQTGHAPRPSPALRGYHRGRGGLFFIFFDDVIGGKSFLRESPAVRFTLSFSLHPSSIMWAASHLVLHVGSKSQVPHHCLSHTPLLPRPGPALTPPGACPDPLQSSSMMIQQHSWTGFDAGGREMAQEVEWRTMTSCSRAYCCERRDASGYKTQSRNEGDTEIQKMEERANVRSCTGSLRDWGRCKWRVPIQVDGGRCKWRVPIQEAGAGVSGGCPSKRPGQVWGSCVDRPKVTISGLCAERRRNTNVFYGTFTFAQEERLYSAHRGNVACAALLGVGWGGSRLEVWKGQDGDRLWGELGWGESRLGVWQGAVWGEVGRVGRQLSRMSSGVHMAATSVLFCSRATRGRCGVAGPGLYWLDTQASVELVSPSEEVTDTEDNVEEELGVLEDQRSVILHLLSQLKLGMDLTRVVLPTFILEKRSLLEMYANFMAHPDMFLAISMATTPEERMVRFVEYYLTAFHEGRKGAVAKKPYNPILGETFHCSWAVPRDKLCPLRTHGHPIGARAQEPDPGTNQEAAEAGQGSYRVRFVAEQVSHHPPVSAFYCECRERAMCVNAHVWTKSKFMGMSVGVSMVGEGVLSLLDHGEEYVFTLPCAYARSILTVPWVELGGKVSITCAKSGYSATVTFHTKPFYGGKVHRWA
ncbi:hypothetical protein P4O66_015851, partial [Electrophorus voltai]